MTQPLLELRNVDTFYGPIHILQKVNLRVNQGELIALLGGNACGKSTTLKTALGLVIPRSGEVFFKGIDVTNMKVADRIKLGLAVVPENRRLFGPLTVMENLQLGAYTSKASSRENFSRVFELFPEWRKGATKWQGRFRAVSSRWLLLLEH